LIEEKERLTIKEIKNHIYFKEIDWDNIFENEPE